MLEQQAPKKVDPAEYEAEESDEKRNDKGNEALRFEERRPSYQNLDDPVDDGDQKQEDLNEPALFVKPCSHMKISFFVD